MSHAKHRAEEPPEAVRARPAAGPHSNDNTPYNNTLWRREYMKIYMRKYRELKRAAKAKEARAALRAARQAGGNNAS